MKDNHLFDDERRPQNGHLDNDSDTAADTSFTSVDGSTYWLNKRLQRTSSQDKQNQTNKTYRIDRNNSSRRYSDIDIEGVFYNATPVASFDDEDGEITYYAESDDYFNQYEDEDEFYDLDKDTSERSPEHPKSYNVHSDEYLERTHSPMTYSDVFKDTPTRTSENDSDYDAHKDLTIDSVPERDELVESKSRDVNNREGIGYLKKEGVHGTSQGDEVIENHQFAYPIDNQQASLDVMPTTRPNRDKVPSTSRIDHQRQHPSRDPRRSENNQRYSGDHSQSRRKKNNNHAPPSRRKSKGTKKVPKRRRTVGDVVMRVVTIISVIIIVVALGLFMLWRYIIGAARTSVTEAPQFVTDEVGETFESTTQPVTIRDGQIINILLMGLDLRQEGEELSRSDTMMLVTIDQRENQVRLTSFQRDMLVYMPGFEEPMKLNAASHYGPWKLIETLNNTFHLDIRDYIMFDIAGAEDIIDAVGGIEVELPDDPDVLAYMRRLIEEQNSTRYGWDDRTHWSPNVWEGGNQLLNGTQAIAYARMRELDSDFRRMDRQQEVVEKMFNKVLSSDPITVANVLRTGLSHITTNMSDIELTQMGTLMLPKLNQKIEHFRIPVDGYFWMDSRDVWCIRANFNLLIPILHQYIYHTNIGEFESVPLVPYTPLEITTEEFMPESVLYGTYDVISYTGAYGLGGGVILNGYSMYTGTNPLGTKSSEPSQGDRVTPSEAETFWLGDEMNTATGPLNQGSTSVFVP